MLANIGSRGGPHSNTINLNVKLVAKCKNNFLIAKFSKSRKLSLDIPLIKVCAVWKSFFTQMSIVSSNGMLVKKHQHPN